MFSLLKRLKVNNFRRPYYIIFFFSTLIILIILSQCYFYNIRIRRKAVEDMKVQNITMARIYEEHAKRTFNIVNQILLDINSEIETQGMDIDLIKYAEKNLIGHKDILNLITIADKEGNTKKFSIVGPNFVNISERTYFNYHKNNKSKEMYIGKPSLGKATGKWFIPMTLRINNKDGSFAGVIIASVNPYYFVEFFKQVVEGRIFLLNNEGIIIASWTDNDANEIGKDYSRSPVFSLTKRSSMGIDISPSIFDQVVRIRAFKVLQNYHVTIVVTNSIKNALNEVKPYLDTYNANILLLITIISSFSLWMFLAIRKQFYMNLALKESEQKALLILNTVTEGIVVIKEQKIVYYNPSVLNILKAKHDYILDRSFFEIISPEEQNDILNRYQKSIDGINFEKKHEFVALCQNGEHINIRVDVTPINWQGELALLACFFDVTQQKQWAMKEKDHLNHIEEVNLNLQNEIKERKFLENENTRYIEEMKNKNQELERFVYTVSHDLRSPLITIKGFANFVKKSIQSLAKDSDSSTALAEKAYTDIDRIDFACDKMSALIDDLLEVSRAGRALRPCEMCDINQIILDVIKMIQFNVNKDHTIINVAEGMPPVFGDRQKIRQLFQNLIENAIKYRDQNRNCEINISYDPEIKAYLVQDNGIGIAQEHSTVIFEVFKKLSSESQGSGIGLSIVKKIVEFHQGKIWLKSIPGEGSTFYFTLNLSKNTE